MSPELEQLIYEGVLQAVLRGAEREEVFTMLRANEITGDSAEAIYRRAWTERVADIRSRGFRKVVEGLLMLAAGTALFTVCVSLFDRISTGALITSGALVVLGPVRIMIGVFITTGANKRKGSIIQDD
jgi:hypothetical protein